MCQREASHESSLLMYNMIRLSLFDLVWQRIKKYDLCCHIMITADIYRCKRKMLSTKMLISLLVQEQEQRGHAVTPNHDDVIKWKHFPRYWPFVRGIHRSPVNSPHKGQWCGAMIFPFICVWIIGWVNNREAGDLRRYRVHYDVIVMGPVSVKPLYLPVLTKFTELHLYRRAGKNLFNVILSGWMLQLDLMSSMIYHCPACRTTLVATRFRVAVICPIIQEPHCIRVFFYFVWFVFINHIFQFYYELCTYCNILDIYLS